MHSVCVCQIHQNVKLLTHVLPSTDHKYLLSLMVCDVGSRNCMLRSCENCPGVEFVRDHVAALFETAEIDSDDTVKFSQWISTDRTELVSLQKSRDDYIDDLIENLEKLRPHHFIAKAQAAFLKQRKENLDSDTAIVLMDFAENFSFVVQDEVQGFHWDHSQATLHPFAIPRPEII